VGTAAKAGSPDKGSATAGAATEGTGVGETTGSLASTLALAGQHEKTTEAACSWPQAAWVLVAREHEQHTCHAVPSIGTSKAVKARSEARRAFIKL
jgi:hypothetical protein